jgi:hypothetical protein
MAEQADSDVVVIDTIAAPRPAHMAGGFQLAEALPNWNYRHNFRPGLMELQRIRLNAV